MRSLDYNLVQDPTDCNLVGALDHTITGRDPVLGPLAQNPPGETQTHALLRGSPAIDAIPPGSCVVSTDQRGVDRPFGEGCDIGAYEYHLAVGGVSLRAHRVGRAA